MKVGTSLKVALAKKKVKQYDLAKAINVKPQHVSRWANDGGMSQDTLESICEYFDMQVSEFIALGEEGGLK